MASLQSRVDKLPLLPVLWRWRADIFEPLLYIGVYSVYLITRGLVFPDESTALANADRVISLEKTLGIFWEPGWQSWALDNTEPLVVFLNWTYLITYFPVVLGLALVLFITNRQLYYYFRNVIMITLAIALVVFMVFPLAPPLKVPTYFVDTIQALGPSFYGGSNTSNIANTDAAMPSLHFTWTIILGVLLVRALDKRLKVLGVLYPTMTFFAITITANHFIVDAIAGGLLAAVSFTIMLGIQRGVFLRRWWPRLKAVSGRYRVIRSRVNSGTKARDR